MGLPVSSHCPKYVVYKIKVKLGKQVNIFESKTANTTEAGYKTKAGAINRKFPSNQLIFR
jgi:hypothetical protein